jgi:hypothetical protein
MQNNHIDRLQVDNTQVFKFHEDICGVKGLLWEPVLGLRGGGGIIRVAGSSVSTLIVRDDSATEYPFYGIHKFQADGLVFIRGEKNIYVDLVDCRDGSQTLHHAIRLNTSPDSARCLRIPPGIAHRPGPLANMVTWNLIRPYWDPRVDSPKDGFDVINCDKDENPKSMPVIKVARWPVPNVWLPRYLQQMHAITETTSQYPSKYQ